MSTTTAASASAPSSVPTGSCRNIYEIPTQDAACAMPFGGNHTDILAKCCKDANVISYYNDCGLYCLAVGQSVADLTECLFDNGAADNSVWCGGSVNATATETGGGSAPTSASARVVATGGADSSDDNDNDNDNNGNDSSSGNGGSSNNDGGSAAAVVKPGMTVMGFAIGALLFSAAALGGFQV